MTDGESCWTVNGNAAAGSCPPVTSIGGDVFLYDLGFCVTVGSLGIKSVLLAAACEGTASVLFLKAMAATAADC